MISYLKFKEISIIVHTQNTIHYPSSHQNHVIKNTPTTQTNIIIELQSPRVGCIEFKNKNERKKKLSNGDFSLRKIKEK